MNKIILITDYRDHFYSSTKTRGASVNLGILQNEFRSYELDIEIIHFSDIDFRSNNYKGVPILYQSSEDRDNFYKSYIEDIVLGLSLSGALVIPEYKLLRAHNNKVFMEILRDISEGDLIKNLRSHSFGTIQEYKNIIKSISSPFVMKPSSGSMSNNIRLFNNKDVSFNHAKKISNTFNVIDLLKYFAKSYFIENYIKESIHRRKFIVQNYISEVKNDYKVLIFNHKYYVLKRSNRKNDFRASGSGIFEWVSEIPVHLLDYAELVFQKFKVPYISLDICNKGDQFFLFEFQFLMFGTLTLEKSEFFFTKEQDKWVQIKETPSLEREIASSVVQYLKIMNKASSENSY